MIPYCLTEEQQLQNCLLATVLWDTVTPRQVYLDDWRRENCGAKSCGMKACFGGWLATWPEFRDQGVRAHRDGFPMLVDENGEETGINGFGVAQYLFGDANLFDGRNFGGRASQHQQVRERLRRRIEELSEDVALEA
jgi:hypothetical protein